MCHPPLQFGAHPLRARVRARSLVQRPPVCTRVCACAPQLFIVCVCGPNMCSFNRAREPSIWMIDPSPSAPPPPSFLFSKKKTERRKKRGRLFTYMRVRARARRSPPFFTGGEAFGAINGPPQNWGAVTITEHIAGRLGKGLPRMNLFESPLAAGAAAFCRGGAKSFAFFSYPRPPPEVKMPRLNILCVLRVLFCLVFCGFR
jgi:hypothetical protein